MINLNNTKLIGAEISRRSYEFRLNFMNLYLKEHPNDMEGYAGYESMLFFLAVCHDADYCIKRRNGAYPTLNSLTNTINNSRYSHLTNNIADFIDLATKANMIHVIEDNGVAKYMINPLAVDDHYLISISQKTFVEFGECLKPLFGDEETFNTEFSKIRHLIK
nr:MAG TPA: hypothetical protein [Bacteriophage sp.]